MPAVWFHAPFHFVISGPVGIEQCSQMILSVLHRQSAVLANSMSKDAGSDFQS